MKPLKKLSTKKKVIISVTGFLFFCFLASLTVDTGSSQKRAAKRYILANKGVLIIHNIQLIREWEDLFNYGTDRQTYHKLWDISDWMLEVDTIEKDKYKVTFKPEYHGLTHKEYLLERYYLDTIANLGAIVDYNLILYLTERQVDSMNILLTLNHGNGLKHVVINDKDFDISKYALKDRIQKQRLAINKRKDEEKRVQQNKERIQKENKHFEDECLSSYDGSCPAVVDYIKKYMNDPNSFEHVETRYGNAGDYYLVYMTYRGKNAFGAIVVNTINLKVTKDCNIIE